MGMTKEDGAPVGDVLREKEEMRDTFRDEELRQALDKLVKAATEKLNDKIEIDGLPPARNESQAEGMADVRGSVSEGAVREVMLDVMPDFFRRYFEIMRQ